MLGGNLGSLLYGDVSVMTCVYCNDCLCQNVTFSTYFFMGLLKLSHVDGFLYVGE